MAEFGMTLRGHTPFPIPTVAGLLSETLRALEEAGSDEARIEAEVLLMEVAGLDRARMYARWGEPLSEEMAVHLRALTARRVRGEPLAYITGHREFFGREFLVDRRVLIPRPETELLVEASLGWLRSRKPGGAGAGAPGLERAEAPPVAPTAAVLAADVGTGSGAIAVSLAAELPGLTLYALDCSPDALAVARANAEQHGVAGCTIFLEGDLVEPLPGPVDLLVANLPYVAYGQLPQWCGAAQTELAWEPFEGLAGGEDGLDVIRRFLHLAPRYLKPEGAVFMEIGAGQGARVRSLAQAAFPGARVEVLRDLAGLDRLVTIEPD